MIGLPDEFLLINKSSLGGGVIQVRVSLNEAQVILIEILFLLYRQQLVKLP